METLRNKELKNLLGEKLLGEMMLAVEKRQKELSRLFEHAAITAIPNQIVIYAAVRDQLGEITEQIEGESVRAVEAMNLAFDEGAKGLANLKKTTQALSEEVAFIKNALAATMPNLDLIKAQTAQLEKFNAAVQVFKELNEQGHIARLASLLNHE